MEECQGPGKPLVFVPRIDVDAEPVTVLRRRARHALVTIANAELVEDTFLGDEDVDEASRINKVTFREVV